MPITAQEHRVTPIAELTLHPKNPRRASLADIVESIEENGFYGTVIAQKSTGFVLAGNHRVQAAQELGMTELDVTWVECDDDTATRILLVDNRTSDKAVYDDEQLLSILSELEKLGDLTGTGWSDDDIRDLERITGAMAREATDFLSDLTDQYSNSDHPLQRDPTKGDDKTVELTQYFSISYLYTFEERTEIINALSRVREDQGLEQASEALLWLARQYLEQATTVEAAE